MMLTLGSYVRRGKRVLRRFLSDPKLRLPLKLAGCFLAGMALSAASLGNRPQPVVLGVLCAGIGGWLPIPFGLGAAAGYWLFWGQAGLQGIVWTAAGLPVCVLLGQKPISRQMPLLQPALAALTVAVSGVLFQVWQGDDTSIPMYLLRVGLAFGASWLFAQVLHRRDTVADWAAAAVAVLARAQIAPLPFLDLGIVAAGAMTLLAPFPAVALAGLALDLAQISPVPMTAVVSLAFVVRLIPGLPKWTSYALPGCVYLTVMALCGKWDLMPIPAFILGGAVGTLLPEPPVLPRRRGATGVAQVRLELAAGVLAQSEQLLLEVPEMPIDEDVLIQKAAERACATCPCRKGCKESEQARHLPTQLLHRPLVTMDDISVSCRKRGRLMLELRRSQDQYRIIKADRDRRREYRGAVLQQYRFLTEFLQDVADSLPQRSDNAQQRFQPEVAVCSAGRESANGDRCLWFAGTGLKYYLLLCDGMGTGDGAAEEARSACMLLRRLLTAGFPAQYALRSFNSLCTLRGSAGAVSLDLAEIRLDSGKTAVYKWGAAPSWLLTPAGPEKIGTAGTPPGLSVLDARETVDRLSLRRGETLVLLSDGVAGEEAMQRAGEMPDAAPGEMAAAILEAGRGEGADDATAAVVRLKPVTVTKA